MATTKMNFTLPKDVVERLLSQVPEGQRSAFVTNSINEKINAIEAEKLHQDMVEGYIARREEDVQTNAEWDPISV